VAILRPHSSTPATVTAARSALPGGRAALLLALVGAFVALPVPQSNAAQDAGGALEQAVKAAYVYNFTKFVSWPAESPLARAAAFTIGVMGDDSLADAIEATVRDKKHEGRPFLVRRFQAAEGVEACNVLYVSRAWSGSWHQILGPLRGWPVLTVSDAGGFASRGGVIGLFIEDNRLRFEVRLAAAQAANLQVSSKLLRLSRPAPDQPCPSCAVGSGRER
jgi:YfiR/HmsC-like